MVRRIILAVILTIYFVLTVVLLAFDLDFKTFNFLEGIYWTIIGMLGFSLLEVVPWKYRKAMLSASLILILFGISDFIEITTGAYWIPWQLLILKIFCIAGLVFSLAWFLKIRLTITIPKTKL